MPAPESQRQTLHGKGWCRPYCEPVLWPIVTVSKAPDMPGRRRDHVEPVRSDSDNDVRIRHGATSLLDQDAFARHTSTRAQPRPERMSYLVSTVEGI